MSYEPQPVEFDGKLLQPLSPEAAERAVASFEATGEAWGLRGCFWPPTDEHLRGCRACQQMIHRERLEAQVDTRKS